VYTWENGQALVQTVDFFTPVVDDPYVYGGIAATNALSDVYAMGGRPLTALAVAGFPRQGLDADTMSRVFRGGFDKLREAGVALLGGHTVQDNEIKFGYAITGVVDPDRLLANAGARPGDVLFLTKPIGTGVISTALKFDRAPKTALDAAVASMLALNRDAAEALASLPRGDVHACTDITGFGLIGHASEMAIASLVTVELDAESVPLLPGALDLVASNRAGGMRTNADHFGSRTRVAGTVNPDRLWLLYDPQTSGGLLAAVDPAAAAPAVDAFGHAGIAAARIGRIVPRDPAAAVVVS
jgi:selenide,water dikinase